MDFDAMQFKQELAELLKKYNVFISVEADGCSDWGGVTGEKMIVVDNFHGKELTVLSEGLHFSHEDLQEKNDV